MTEGGIKTVLPIFNSEEKVDEINRLLDILSKRKRYSILVTMLLVFQKYNFQKLLKEFLVEGVQQIILANPFKVVSFSGVPFTIKNCFMGMRVIIGKHRIFQKESVDGYEYLNVNLVYTCIFLTDEIAKICKGSKNSKPVHSSLLDELDIVENNNNNNNPPSGLNMPSLGMPNTNNLNHGSSNNSTSSNTNTSNNMLNEKRKRSKNNSQEEEDEDDFNDDPEEEQDNDSKNTEYEEASTQKKKKKNNNNKKKNKKSNNNSNENKTNGKHVKTKASNAENHKNEKAPKSKDNIISIGDSEESDENLKKNRGLKNNSPKKNNKNSSNKKNIKEAPKPINQLFANIFYPKDVNYFKCSLQDFLTVWNFDKSSPVNVYLKDNYQNISKIKNVFNFMQNIGAKGQSFLEKLIKYIPELNNAASLTEEEKEKINENEDLKESKEILDKINSINSVYKEYENKKKKLVNIYQRIKSTVENIKIGATSEGKLFLKEDIEYLDMINKRFDQIMNEIIPLFNQLCDYHKENMLKNISFSLQNVSRNLKENDLTLKSFSIFIQNLIGLFPHESTSINTVNDLILNESISVKEREEKFREIITKEKDLILSNIDEYRNIYEEEDKKIAEG